MYAERAGEGACGSEHHAAMPMGRALAPHHDVIHARVYAGPRAPHACSAHMREHPSTHAWSFPSMRVKRKHASTSEYVPMPAIGPAPRDPGFWGSGLLGRGSPQSTSTPTGPSLCSTAILRTRRRTDASPGGSNRRIAGPLKERKKNAEAWISGSGSVVHPTPQESQGVTADRQVEQDGENEQRN